MDEAREPDPAGGPSENRASKSIAKGKNTGDALHDITAIAVLASQSKPEPTASDESKPAHEVVTIDNDTNANKAMAPPGRIFRLMDLPTELRIMIAEYALTDKDELNWYWKDFTFRSGIFMSKSKVRLVDLTALSRVSKQLYEETAGLVWKWNRFNFGLGFSFSDYKSHRSYWNRFGHELLEAELEFFLQKAPPKVIGCIRNISMLVKPDHTVAWPWFWTHGLAAGLIQQLPYIAHVKIIMVQWTLDGDTPDLDEFIEHGRQVLGHLQTRLVAGKERKWRVFPDLKYYERTLLEQEIKKREMKAADIEEVMGWVEHGI